MSHAMSLSTGIPVVEFDSKVTRTAFEHFDRRAANGGFVSLVTAAKLSQ